MRSPSAGKFRNPILDGDRPDPTVIKSGDDYWMTYSSFDSAPGIPIYHSTDLVNWTHRGSALQDPPGVVFAMDIAEVDGHFYIYIPFIPAPWSTTITDASIFVIHAPTMTGPWSDPIDLHIRGAIDPGHAIGEDGKRYLFVNGVRKIQLTDDGLATVGDLEHAYDGWQYPDEWITEAYALEGPKILRRNGWFYLVSAVGGTGGPSTGHMVIVARSRSIEGVWENSPSNPVARTTDPSEAWWSRGHATLIEGPRGDWWMLSHGYENGYRTLGRQLLLEPIAWTDDDWPVAFAQDISVELDAPDRSCIQAPGSTGAEPHTEFELGDRWTFYGQTPGDGSRLTVGQDSLEVVGKGDSVADSSPLVRTGGDRSYEFSAVVELDGDAEAGLMLFFNNRLFCGHTIDGTQMSTYSGGVKSHWREPIPSTRRIHLKLVNDQHILTSWHSFDGENWTRHGVRYETSGYHANTMGDLVSLRPALVSVGTGSAKFSEVRYQPL
ncbi:xylan 1,4-beta-xylosidase [Pseudoclavibacter sp. AY1F1]|uniref:family 43 glycosylhydrolase n=1 Tax=Pseudoclavibacter sp. AY1F1 TaxID=2080583 RepID=UPI000CE77E04|nr:family 43 glycosylhydrolase [Pseudoclavibacter sp. AY1F1]PPF43297.1 xylan 1,4-beta-xylosidase [Pseudoclavibacter sp. AY1F1]